MSTDDLSRNEWRHRLREQRQCLTKQYADESAHRAARQLSSDQLWQVEHIALYFCNDGELDPSIIAQAAWKAGKHVYLPVITGATGMQFCEWSATAPLKKNHYGIGEPQGAPITASVLELLLLPTVGWSASGFRLGMGGGYYDRFLASNDCTGALRLGLAYDCQREDALDAVKEPWDQPLDGVLTESGVKRFTGLAD